MASPFSATSTSLHNHLGALDALLEVGAFISYPIYHDFVAKIRHLASLPLLMPGSTPPAEKPRRLVTLDSNEAE